MYITVIVLLGAVLSSFSGSTATTPTIDFPTTVHSFGVYADDFPTKRMLRSYDSDDDERVGGLEKLSQLTKAGTSKLTESAKLKSYLIQNKDAVQVLVTLKLGNDALGALRSSKLNVLEKYIKMFNKKNRDKPISLVSTLTARYGDDDLAKALVLAENEATTPAKVKEIQTLRNDQLTNWLNADKSVDDVFNLLKLHNDGKAALTKVEVLEEYIKKINSVKSEHITLLNTLRTALGGDDKLVSIIAMAKVGTVNRKEKALELETALIAKWSSENVLPERIFRRLKLNKNGNVENVLSSDKLETFTKYVDEFNTKNPNREASLLGSLTTNYGEAAVAKGLILAKEFSSTQTLVTKLQLQLFERWMNSGKSVGDVSKLLKIGDDGIEALTSPKFIALKSYLKLFNFKKDADETMVKALATGFGGEDKLSSMLLSAKMNPSLEEKATKLQKAQFNQWLYDEITPHDVLTKVFKIPKQQSYLATDTQKAIVNEFKSFELNSRIVVEPRRA